MVYFIEHIRKVEKYFLDRKYIAICSTQEKAEEVVEKFRTYEGFEDFPDGFKIKRHFIDKVRTKTKKEINKVYFLGLYREYADDTVDTDVLGFFRLKKKQKNI